MDDLSPGQLDVFEVLDLIAKEGTIPAHAALKCGGMVPGDVIAYDFSECACTQDGHLFCSFLKFPAKKRRCRL